MAGLLEAAVMDALTADLARLVDDNLQSARQWAAQQLPTASDWMHAYMHGLYIGLMTGAIAMPGAYLERGEA